MICSKLVRSLQKAGFCTISMIFPHCSISTSGAIAHKFKAWWLRSREWIRRYWVPHRVNTESVRAYWHPYVCICIFRRGASCLLAECKKLTTLLAIAKTLADHGSSLICFISSWIPWLSHGAQNTWFHSGFWWSAVMKFLIVFSVSVAIELTHV